jgi:hypothetical protein
VIYFGIGFTEENKWTFSYFEKDTNYKLKTDAESLNAYLYRMIGLIYKYDIKKEYQYQYQSQDNDYYVFFSIESNIFFMYFPIKSVRKLSDKETLYSIFQIRQIKSMTIDDLSRETEIDEEIRYVLINIFAPIIEYNEAEKSAQSKV